MTKVGVNVKIRKLELQKEAGLCPLCPYHRAENRTWKKARPDRYKSRRKGRVGGGRRP